MILKVCSGSPEVKAGELSLEACHLSPGWTDLEKVWLLKKKFKRQEPGQATTATTVQGLEPG